MIAVLLLLLLVGVPVGVAFSLAILLFGLPSSRMALVRWVALWLLVR